MLVKEFKDLVRKSLVKETQAIDTVEGQKLLNEGITFYQYRALCQIRYNPDPKLNLGAERLAELLRAVPGATRISTSSIDRKSGIAVYSVRIISQKPAKEAFVLFKKNALSKFKHDILDVKVAAATIEKKGFIGNKEDVDEI